MTCVSRPKVRQAPEGSRQLTLTSASRGNDSLTGGVSSEGDTRLGDTCALVDGPASPQVWGLPEGAITAAGDITEYAVKLQGSSLQGEPCTVWMLGQSTLTLGENLSAEFQHSGFHE